MAFSTGGQNLVCSGVSFNISLVAAIRASVNALRSSGLSLACEACCAYAEPATKRTVTNPTTVFNIGILPGCLSLAIAPRRSALRRLRVIQLGKAEDHELAVAMARGERPSR